MKICICTTPIRPIATSFPPLGSIAVIQALRNIGEQVNFYHIDYHRYTYDQNSKYFATNQFDMVGISAVVSTAYAYTKNLIELIKVIPRILFKSSSVVFLSLIVLTKFCAIISPSPIMQ